MEGFPWFEFVLILVPVVYLLVSWFREWTTAPPMKPLLILDVNNILVSQKTHKRPHLDAFVSEIFKIFTVAVWSSQVDHNLICELAFGPNFRPLLLFEWNRANCREVLTHEPESIYSKELTEVWKAFPEYNETNTLMIDHDSDQVVLNPGQCVQLVPSWTPDQMNDRMLLFLLRKLRNHRKVVSQNKF